MKYRIIQDTWWYEDGSSKSRYYIQIFKKWWIFKWWSYVREYDMHGSSYPKDFGDTEKARSWVRSKKSWVDYYGDVSNSTKIVEEKTI